MYRTPTSKTTTTTTTATPSISRTTDSPRTPKIITTPKRPDRSLTQTIKRRVTTPDTPLPKWPIANEFSCERPSGISSLERKEYWERQTDEANTRYKKIKDILNRSRNLKKEILNQALETIQQMHECFIEVNNNFYHDARWYSQQDAKLSDECEEGFIVYTDLVNKKQSLRRELSGLKDKLQKEVEHIGIQTETEAKAATTSTITQTDSTDRKTTSTNTEMETQTIQTTQTSDKYNDQMDKLLRQNIKSNEELRKTVQQMIQKTPEDTRKTKEDNDKTTKVQETGGAWPKQQRLNMHPTLYSLAIAPIDSLRHMKTADNVLTTVREGLDAKSGNVSVEKVRKAKDAKVIVSCASESARNLVKEKLERVAKDITVQIIKNKDPLIILKDVSKHNTDDDILAALRIQNDEIFNGLKDEDAQLTIAYKRQAKNPQAHHVVLRVSPQIWQRSTDQGTLKIDLQRVRVLDQSPLTQCSTCLGYGHSKKFCTQGIETCSHCGGTHKVGKQCADWLAGTPPSCTNCVRAKADKTDHNAFDSVCPIRRKWDALARSTVAYS